MSVWRWAFVGLVAFLGGYLWFAAIRSVGDRLFAVESGPSAMWILSDFLAEFVFGFAIVSGAAYVAPPWARPRVTRLFVVLTAVLSLLSMAVTLYAGSIVGRAIPVAGMFCTILGAAAAAFWWSEKARIRS